jgi:hypothetical protein
VTDVLVTSRSFEEYVAFFALDPAALPLKVLDCCAGASGFVAAAGARGVKAVAIDPAYAYGRATLIASALRGARGAAALVQENQNRFTFAWYGTRERQLSLRGAALRAFEADLGHHPGRYVAAALPMLPFRDRAFDLVLCSHLLFTWADVLDETWHERSLVEMCRVGREVRVFPLVHSGTGDPVEFLPRLRERLLARFGVESEVVEVPFEFQLGARHFLRLRRAL